MRRILLLSLLQCAAVTLCGCVQPRGKLIIEWDIPLPVPPAAVIDGTEPKDPESPEGPQPAK